MNMGKSIKKRIIAGSLALIMVLPGHLPVAVAQDIEIVNPVTYFVDCGDYMVNTVCADDKLGTSNSVTDKVYGVDDITGYSWGILDTISEPLKNGSTAGKGVFTDNTWPHEVNTANLDVASKTDSNRYTKNQTENGVEVRYLDYKFELKAGTYQVETYTANPWNCSNSPSLLLDVTGKTAEEITADFQSGKGSILTPQSTTKQEVVMAEDGDLMVSYRGEGAENLAINVCYIKITDASKVSSDGLLDKDLNAIIFGSTVLTGNIKLPTTGENGSTITWISSAPNIIAVDGTVNRPAIGQPNAEVILTATVSNEGIEKTKDFTFTVYAQSNLTGVNQFDLDEVVITDPYYKAAQDTDIVFLKKFNNDRLLSRFRETAGLNTNSAAPYGGWENSLIGGHAVGHYLTACAQAIETTGDQELTDKLASIVDELKKCQEALGTGYIFGAKVDDKTNVEKQFDIVEGKLTGSTWVPWYTMHKILAGLIDIYKCTGDEDALIVAKDLGTWIYNRVNKWSSSVQTKISYTEYGGMNDCLYELYKLTGDISYRDAAHKFDDPNLYKVILSGKTDTLNKRHANATIPKFVGALNRYSALKESNAILTADDEKYLEYATGFWSLVVEKHAFITGGTSDMEHFKSDNALDATRTQCNCESCCAHNMLKLSKELFKITGEKKYADYYESTLRNAIMGAVDATNGATSYFTPMATGYYKVFGNTDPSKNMFWCCTGSGMENYTKLGDSIYFKKDNSLVVNQYVASDVTWEEKNIRVVQKSDVSTSDVAEFTINLLNQASSADMKLVLRVPDWIDGEPELKINGENQNVTVSNGYMGIDRNWKQGDVVTLKYPMKIVAYGLADNSTVFGFKYGPTVLAAKLGREKWDSRVWAGANLDAAGYKVVGKEEAYLKVTYGATTKQVLGSETLAIQDGVQLDDFMNNINQYLVKNEASSTLEFQLKGTDAENIFDADLTFVPFNTLNAERYGIYWYFEGGEYVSSEDKILREKEEGRFAASIVDSIQPGYGQYETDAIHQLQESNTVFGNMPGIGSTRYAKAGGSFSYNMVVKKGETNSLLCQFAKEDNNKTIKVTVGDTVVCQDTLSYDGEETYYKKYYEIPESECNNAQVLQINDESYDIVKVKVESNDQNDSARLVSGLYMTIAYNNDATIKELTSPDGIVQSSGDSFTLTVPEGTQQVKVNVTIADTSGLLRVGGVLVNDTKIQTIDLTGAETNVNLTVFGEDHTTSKEYSLIIKYGDIQPVETVTLEYAPTDGGSIQGTTSQIINKGSDAQAVTAVANEGYEFVKWDDGLTTVSRTDKNVQISKIYKAIFQKKSVIIPTPLPVENVAGTEATDIKLRKNKIIMGVKEKVTLKATVIPAAALQNVTWKSSNKSVLTVSSDGKLTAKKTGTATITASTENGKSVTCKVTVKKTPKKVTLNKKTKVLKKGKTYQLKVSLPAKTASYQITYSSSKKSVVIVSATGKVKAKGKGNAVVTVKTFNGKKAIIKIKVK